MFKGLFGFAFRLTASEGVKRVLTCIFVFAIGILASFPSTLPYAAQLQAATGVLGLTAIAHATLVGTLDQKKLAGLVSFLTALVAIAEHVPALQPYVPWIQQALAFLATAGVTTAVRSSNQLK